MEILLEVVLCGSGSNACFFLMHSRTAVAACDVPKTSTFRHALDPRMSKSCGEYDVNNLYEDIRKSL